MFTVTQVSDHPSARSEAGNAEKQKLEATEFRVASSSHCRALPPYLASTSSTSKIRVAPAGITPGTPRAP
jgi:hypothetical protein